MLYSNLMSAFGNILSQSNAITKVGNDPNKYETYTLNNGVKTILIYNSCARESKFYVSIDAGACDDPKGMQGIARLLTLMIKMKLKEYQDRARRGLFTSGQLQQDFSCVVNQDTTVFSNSVPNEGLREVITNVVSILASPAASQKAMLDILQSMVKQDRNKLESSLRLTNQALLDTMLSSDKCDAHISPFYNRLDDLEPGELLVAISEFWNTHYTANKICLIIYSSLSTKELKDIAFLFEYALPAPASPSCASLSNNQSCMSIDQAWPYNTTGDYIIFRRECYQYIYRVASKTKTNALIITINMPAMLKLYKRCSVDLLTMLYSDCAVHMLYPYWAKESWSNIMDVAILEYKRCTRVEFTIILTQHGVREYEKVLNSFVEFLNKIQVTQEYYAYWLELMLEQKISSSVRRIDTLLKSIATDVHKYPTKDIIAHQYPSDDYDAYIFHEVSALISDRTNWIVTLYDANYTREPNDTQLQHSGVYFRKDQVFTYNATSTSPYEDKETLDHDTPLLMLSQPNDILPPVNQISGIIGNMINLRKHPASVLIVNVSNENSVLCEFLLRIAGLSVLERYQRLKSFKAQVSIRCEENLRVVSFHVLKKEATAIVQSFLMYLKTPPVKYLDVTKASVMWQYRNLLGHDAELDQQIGCIADINAASLERLNTPNTAVPLTYLSSSKVYSGTLVMNDSMLSCATFRQAIDLTGRAPGNKDEEQYNYDIGGKRK